MFISFKFQNINKINVVIDKKSYLALCSFDTLNLSDRYVLMRSECALGR